MQSHLKQPLLFDKEIGRFEEKVWFATEAEYTYSESSANRSRKSPLNLKKSVGFQPIYCLIYGFRLIVRLFYLYFGLFRFYQM